MFRLLRIENYYTLKKENIKSILHSLLSSRTMHPINIFHFQKEHFLSLSKITTTAKKDKEKAFEAHPEYDASLTFPISYQGDPIRPLESERKKLKVAGNCNFIRALQRAQHTHTITLQ